MIIKAVFFDFDGTLADTAPDMICALNDWLAVRCRPPVDTMTATAKVSGGVRALLELAGLNGEDPEAAREEYLKLYERTQYAHTVLFPEVEQMLLGLTAAGLSWGVITNKPRHYFAPIAKSLKLAEKNAAVLLAAGDAGKVKPQPDMLLAAAKSCNLRDNECVYVGDDARDAQAAKAAGMKFITAAWGYWQGEAWGGDSPTAAIVTSPALLTSKLWEHLPP